MSNSIWPTLPYTLILLKESMEFTYVTVHKTKSSNIFANATHNTIVNYYHIFPYSF